MKVSNQINQKNLDWTLGALLYQLVQQWIDDTDLDWDDQIALLYLLNQTQIQIKAISIEKRGKNACQLALSQAQDLLKLSHQENIPLVCGQEQKAQFNSSFRLQNTGPVNILALGPNKPG